MRGNSIVRPTSKYFANYLMGKNVSVPSKREKFKCGQSGCEQTFKRLRTLKSHMDLKHSNMKKDYLCSDCGRCLESYTGYRQHLAKHGAPVYIKRNYPVCGS